MSRYDELRVFYGRSPDERMVILEQEMRAPLEAACRIAADLGTVDPSTAPALFGGRFDELIEILAISAAKLADVAAQAPAVCARGQERGGLRDEEVHVFRHDLLTPIGTVRGVAGMLAKCDPDTAPDLPPDFVAKAQALAEAINELKDVLDALTDARGRA